LPSIKPSNVKEKLKPLMPSHPSVSERLRDELKRLGREGRTTLELSVTNRYPDIGKPIDCTVRLWHFDPLYIRLPVQWEKVAVWRSDTTGTSTKMDVITDESGRATVTETYAGPADLTYYAEYTPSSDSPFTGSRSNTVMLKARIGTRLTLEWPANERMCTDLRCCGPVTGRLADQYDHGLEGREIVISAHWDDSNNGTGIKPILTLKSDSAGLFSQVLTHYQITGDYEWWSDRIKAEFVGDDAHHATDSGWVLATGNLRLF
jgi:hypothetical protein